jgi:cobalamin biosynthesis Mg chelatase CobN
VSPEDAAASRMPGPADPEEIKAQIDATREQLAATVDELSRRLDVPARAKEGVYRARDTAVETYRESPSIVLGILVALVATAVGLVVWRHKRSSTRRK